MSTLKEQVEELDRRVALFAHNNFPIDFFAMPESARLRANGSASFTTLETLYAQNSERMAVVQRGWRFRAVAKLQGRFILPHFGHVRWLKIDEPTKNQAEAGQVGVVSLRFLYPDLERLAKVFKARQVAVERTDEGVVAQLTGGFQTVEFSDADADTVLDWQLATGEAVNVIINK